MAQMSKGVKCVCACEFVCVCTRGGEYFQRSVFLQCSSFMVLLFSSVQPSNIFDYFTDISIASLFLLCPFYIKKVLCVRGLTFQGYCIANGLIKSRELQFCFLYCSLGLLFAETTFFFFSRICTHTKESLVNLWGKGGDVDYLKCY